MFLGVVLTWHQKSKQGTRKNLGTRISNCSAVKLPPCGLVVFKDINLYLYLQKEGISKHS